MDMKGNEKEKPMGPERSKINKNREFLLRKFLV